MERITDDHVVLFEQTIAKNREVISENKKLREELKQRDELKKTSRSLEYCAAAHNPIFELNIG